MYQGVPSRTSSSGLGTPLNISTKKISNNRGHPRPGEGLPSAGLVFPAQSHEKDELWKSFRNWIKLLYKDVNSRILNNGYPTRQICLMRVIHQGCPLSWLLYCLVVETLANLIRDNSNIEGLYLPGHKEQSKISQHTDDTLQMLLGKYSVQEVFKMINIYEQGSGSKLNSSQKSQLEMWKY